MPIHDSILEALQRLKRKKIKEQGVVATYNGALYIEPGTDKRAIAMESIQPGLYSFFHLSKQSGIRLHDWCERNGIPNPLPEDKLHSTVIWSTSDVPDYEPYRGSISISPETYHFDVLGGALVLRYANPTIENQWNIGKKLGATFTFNKYLPHITLSYNPEGFDASKIFVPYFPIILERETAERLNPGSKAKNDLDESFADYLENL